MDRNEFEKVLGSVRRCYSKYAADKLPSFEDFNQDATPIASDNKYHLSVALRIKAINNLRYTRNTGSELDIKYVWRLISESLHIIPKEATISSIGSQGFLSIPLFKYDDDMSQFEFIRLHIWDKSLEQHFNRETCQNFSIHSHLFFAESWVLCGNVINERYNVRISPAPSLYSLFEICYNNSINNVNQHTSIAKRTNQFVDINQISHEEYMQGGNYIIKAGHYHKSAINNEDEISATLFSFTANKACPSQSFVVGPSSIVSSEINRTQIINPKDLIKKIDFKLK
jgi:hypothetical protein